MVNISYRYTILHCLCIQCYKYSNKNHWCWCNVHLRDSHEDLESIRQHLNSKAVYIALLTSQFKCCRN